MNLRLKGHGHPYKMKIGKLEINWNKKALKPSKTILQVMGMSLTWNTADDTVNYTSNSAVYSIINRITRTAANAPFKVYRVKDRKKFHKYKNWTGANATKESLQNAMMIKEQVFEEDNKHPLNVLLDMPNGFQRQAEFTANSIGYKLLTGNRYWFVNKLEQGLNAGKPYSIENLPPQHISVRGDGTLFGIKEYVFNMGQVKEIPKENIIHSKYWNPEIDTTGTHLVGLSPLKAASKNIQRLNDGLDRSVTMMQNAGGAGLLFDKSGVETMTPEEALALKRRINTEVLGMDNAGKIALANGDMGYINFGMSAVDMQILEMEKYSLQQLCNIYGVPYVLFSSDNSTYNNIQEAKKELITMAVIPELASLRDDWNEVAKLYGGDIYVDYDISVYPELQEDLEKVSRIMLSSWWIKPNEKRLAMNMDEDNDNELMNDYIIPSGMQKLEDLNGMDEQMNVIDNELNQNRKP